MGRKTEIVLIDAEGRDKGKRFLITEMSAYAAEQWATRALISLLGSGAPMPEGIEVAGMAGLAEMGLRAFSGLSYDKLKPLLDEMMTCVQAMPDPRKPSVVMPLIVDTHIEEIMTLVKLRTEVWNLHTGFLKAALPSIFQTGAAMLKGKSPTTSTSQK